MNATASSSSAFRQRAPAAAPLLEGAQAVHIKGRDVGVRAQIHHLNSMSAHADSDGSCDGRQLHDAARRHLSRTR